VESRLAEGLAEIAKLQAELQRDIKAMEGHQERHEGRIDLNVGGIHFHTSVQTLRRLPNTFFHAYFSGRYAQDVCDDGSIFVDRNGEHFGYVLEYLRTGVLSVAEPDARPSVALLRALKSEFGFYSIELNEEPVEQPVESQSMVLVMGGKGRNKHTHSSMERYDASTGKRSYVAAMDAVRKFLGACVIGGELYVTGGSGTYNARLASVSKYSPVTNTWTSVAPLPAARSGHIVVAVGPIMYVVGGGRYGATASTTFKFDSRQGTWSQVAPMPEERESCAACVVGSDIFIFGG
jgi:hypothetical protein